MVTDKVLRKKKSQGAGGGTLRQTSGRKKAQGPGVLRRDSFKE